MKVKGFTQIENDLLEAIIQLQLTDHERRIMLLVIRLTFGCQKRWAQIRPADLSVVGVYRPNAGKALRVMVEKGLIVREERDNLLAINQNISEWRVEAHAIFDPARFSALLTKALARRKPRGYQIANNDISDLIRRKSGNVSSDRNDSFSKETKETLKKENKGLLHIFSDGTPKRYQKQWQG